MKEIWKDIKEYEGLYQVSNFGNVKTLNYNNSKKEKKLKMGINQRGYNIVSLRKNNKTKIKKVHRLVAEAFISNLENKPQVNHKDGNKQNNYIGNLEWVNNSENMKHAYKNKLRLPLYKKVSQYDLKGVFIREWDSIFDAGKILKIDTSNICKCCRNKIKTIGGYKWKYTE